MSPLKKPVSRLLLCLLAATLLLTPAASLAYTKAELEDPENPIYAPVRLETASYGQGYTHAERFSGAEILHGVDVSKWQRDVDWEQVRDSGISFAILRIGYRGTAEGTLNQDEYFEQNYKNASAAGLPLGVYIYSQAITEEEAAEEAEYVLDILGGRPLELPIVFDYEYAGATGQSGRLYNARLTDAQRTANCLAFCRAVEEAGYQAMIYANKWMLESELNADELSEYQIWLAQYNTRVTYTGDYHYWQYTDGGTVPGIPGTADMNFRYVFREHGWKNIEGRWYYYLDGQPIQGEAILEGYERGGSTGPQTYFFNDDGSMFTGFKKLDGRWRYFYEPLRSGNPMTTITGQMAVNAYADAPAGGYRTPSEIEQGKTFRYYFDGNGVMFTGWYNCDLPFDQTGNWRYFIAEGSSPVTSRLGRMCKYGLINEQYCIGNNGEHHSYFFSSTGGMMKGSKTIHGQQVTFCTEGSDPRTDLLGALLSQ